MIPINDIAPAKAGANLFLIRDGFCRPPCFLAAAAVVVAAAIVATAVAAAHGVVATAAEQDQQNDDPAPVTAAKTIVTHKNYLPELC